MRNITDRYYNDIYFKRLVDTFLHEARELRTTPTEIREAAMVAQYIFELENPRPILMIEPKDFK